MATTTSYIINAQSRVIQIYAPEERVLSELRDNRGAFKVGDSDQDVMTYNDLRNFRISASNWAESEVRTYIHKDRIPFGFPVPIELENAAISYTLYLVRDRITAGNRADDQDDQVVNFLREANDHIQRFILNLDVYPELVSSDEVQITSAPKITTQTKILIGGYGLDSVEGGFSMDGNETEPELKDGFNSINRTN